MTNREAVLRIKDHMNVHKIGEYPHVYIAEALNMAIAALESTREWIPCEAGLPEEHEKIELIYDPLSYAVVDSKYHMVSDMVNVTVHPEIGDDFCCSDLTVDGRWEIEGCEEYTVTAWSPIPNPYIKNYDAEEGCN